MFTGLYPDQHTMLHASSVLPETLPTLAERLAQAGYFTAAFCNNPLLGVVNTGLQRGFYSFLNYSGWMTSRPNQEGKQSSAFDRYRSHFKRVLASTVTSLQDVFARSNTLLDISFSPLMAPLWQTALSFKGNTARSLQHAARLHVERRGLERDQPIFSFINLMGTHMPYHPPPHFVERVAPYFRKDKAAQRFIRQFNSDVFGWLAPLSSVMDKQSKDILDSMYNAEVANQDELVGNFFEKLRTSGALDNTLLIVCADHGEHLGEKQFMGHSISLYDTLVHVPLIIRDPTGHFPRASTVEQVVSTRRIFHTALAAASEANEQEQAYSLAQDAANDPDQGGIFATGITPQNLLSIMQRRRPDLIKTYKCDQPRYAIWRDRYKLIQTGEDDLELYDVFDDPNEHVNLRDILPEQVERLQAQLQIQIEQHAHAANTVEPALEDTNDPQVQRRLHDLGYLE
jgi:arylsulfatase A-like enzyme